MADLILNNISKSFKGKNVLNNISIELRESEILALLGESGSGKSTLLRIISGFEVPDSGEVKLGERVLVNATTFVKPESRNIGMIFQDYALFPHLTIHENIRFGCKSKRDVLRVNELASLFELNDQLMKKPANLSGGQQQRVAIARALAAQPRILLLDEPFSNLDQSLRRRIRAEIKRVNTEFGVPLVLVSHDPEDALELADRIAVLRDGEIIQIDTPEQLYKNPVNAYIGNLFGYISEWTDGRLLRPEKISVSILPADHSIEGVITNVVFHASGRYLIQVLGNDNHMYYAFSDMKHAIGTRGYLLAI